MASLRQQRARHITNKEVGHMHANKGPVQYCIAQRRPKGNGNSRHLGFGSFGIGDCVADGTQAFFLGGLE